jgi:LmbE family N-acetylglucosaminyl deacetylase
MSRILVAVPHADELAFHVGGTIAKRVADGHSVYQVVVTTGATSSFTKEKGEMEQIIRKRADQRNCWVWRICFCGTTMDHCGKVRLWRFRNG